MSDIRFFSIVFTVLISFAIFWYCFSLKSIIIFNDSLMHNNILSTHSNTSLTNPYTPSTNKTIPPTRSISDNSIPTRSYQMSTKYSFIPKTKKPHESWTKYFHPTMTAKQKTGMLNLLKVFKNQMEKYSITYFLYGGSLIGADRHHGFIPWDDDIDILIDSNKKQQLKVALQELNNTHNLIHLKGDETSKWKFYEIDGHSFSHSPHRYPYLDLFFFKQFNETMFYVEKENELMSKNNIFPLVDKMFEGIALPTPCNTDGVLKGTYINLNKCSSPSWNHSTEYRVPDSQQRTVDCDLLKPIFPFVERRIEKMSDRNHVLEILRQGKTVVQIVTYSTPLVCSMSYSHYPSNLFITKIED